MACVAVHCLCLAVMALVLCCVSPLPPQKVDERKDERVIYVPPPSVGSLFGGGGNTANKQYRKTTYYVMEAEKASQMSSQTFVNAMLMGFLSYKMEVHLPLVRACVCVD